MNREGECGLDESDTPQAATLPYLAGEKKLRSPTHKRRTSRGLIVYTIIHSTISDNIAGGFGGGLYSDAGRYEITNATISGNQAGTQGNRPKKA